MTKKISENKIENKLLSDNILSILVLALVSIFSFYLGKMSSKYQQNIASHANNQPSENIQIIKKDVKTMGVIASKKGTKYHLPWCPGATSMTSKNKIYFNSIAEAEAAGYSKALNCQGL